MVPEKILDTRVGPDGRRYYKVQWATTTMEKGNNLLEAELLIKKYWDPAQKKLVLPSMRGDSEEGAGGSGAGQQQENMPASEPGNCITPTAESSCCEGDERGGISGNCVDAGCGGSSAGGEGEDEEIRSKRKRSEEGDCNTTSGACPGLGTNSNSEQGMEIATKRTKDESDCATDS